jgi:hypothetical protein
MCGRNFLPSDFGDVLANLATTSRAMDQIMLQLDSAGQKGPEITFEGILILVEGRFTAERSGSDLTKTHLPPMAPVFLHISRKLLNKSPYPVPRQFKLWFLLTGSTLSPFQLLMQPPFSLPFSARTNTTVKPDPHPTPQKNNLRLFYHQQIMFSTL